MLHWSQSTPTSAVWNLSGIALAEITGIVAKLVPPRLPGGASGPSMLPVARTRCQSNRTRRVNPPSLTLLMCEVVGHELTNQRCGVRAAGRQRNAHEHGGDG